ncbi:MULTISPECIES: translation initiation factor IF-2 [Sedimentibacter]|uniref:Translation initiation factor IF-2 n=1 Tax=Sedimentibacter hydroxybenzoicus DSM 7310 TaxID=1123245 RepID=A0A974BKE6_SEDHY|nr:MULTISPECIES: translation initiation factor IF-2 [Sedimentibacter]NYB74372.1 translation initiation factor IF-2 [Sedimentibacter hydroxybenzoicus DSM 7310]
MRIYELAKELKMNSKDLVVLAEQELGITIKNHMSSITDLEVIRLKKALNIINNNKKVKPAKSAKTEIIDDEPLVDEKIDLNTAKFKKVDKKIITPVKKPGTAKPVPKVADEDKSAKDFNQKFPKKNNHQNKFKKPFQPFQQKQQEQPVKKEIKIKNIEMEDSIVVRTLADKLGVPVNAVISKLILLGVMCNMNQEIDFDTAQLIGEEFNAKISKIEVVDVLQDLEDSLSKEDTDNEADLIPRPPIVTVMGHVDHGKTSLLDAIRNTAVTSQEAGGITQHIGASQVEINGKKITLLDTPGHEAFTAMRARGAKVTDIAIIVVAADDGVMPQTIEAINHSKAAGVPIIVAVNKIDKPTANMDRVKQELSEQGIISEDWGGDTIFVPVSAKQHMGIEDLLEMILLVAEVQEFKANPNRSAKGTIIEAKLDKGRGSVATVLIEKGTLNKGDVVLVGSAYGKVRAMFNSKGKKINQAGPSVPVEILGLSETPQAGDILMAMDNEKDAKNIAEKRKNKRHLETMNASSKVSLDDLFDRIQKGEVKDLNIIIKADVSGSIEAVKQSLLKLSMDEVKVNPIHGGVGGINENDVMLASASNAIVIGFNVRPSIAAMDLAKKENVDIRTYNIIYTAIEDIQQAVKGMLAPVYKEVVLGRADVRQTFKVPNVGIVAGVYVTSGKITRKSKIRLLRNDIVIHEGDIASLKRFKDDVSELNTGYEGGIGIEKYNDIKEGDSMEAYIMEEIKR